MISQPISVSFFTLGWEFVANSNVEVDGLGAFLGPDGFNQTQQVGLWDVSTGNLIAHAFVTGDETPVGAAPWVFEIHPCGATDGRRRLCRRIAGRRGLYRVRRSGDL